VSAPDLIAAIATRVRRTRMVAEALHDNTWIRDIPGALTVPVLVQYIELRRLSGLEVDCFMYIFFKHSLLCVVFGTALN
jgi:hypothetical protein